MFPKSKIKNIMANHESISTLIENLEGTLRFMEEAGVGGVACTEKTRKILESWDSVAAREQKPAVGKPAPGVVKPDPEPEVETGPPVIDAPPPPVPPEFEPPARQEPEPPAATVPVRQSAESETLEAIQADLGDCTRCPLSETRRNIVFGEGSPKARLMFVGEGPGYDEDRQGRPFVGAAGQLLTKIIQAMGLSREEVYIGNIIKCRPPKNRNPQPIEIETCYPFLQRQVEAIGPEVICALGKFAAQTLLATETPISRLRGRFHEYRGIPVMPTFHPAFLLRNEARKRDTWEDVQKIMAKLGLSLPGA